MLLVWFPFKIKDLVPDWIIPVQLGQHKIICVDSWTKITAVKNVLNNPLSSKHLFEQVNHLTRNSFPALPVALWTLKRLNVRGYQAEVIYYALFLFFFLSKQWFLNISKCKCRWFLFIYLFFFFVNSAAEIPLSKQFNLSLLIKLPVLLSDNIPGRKCING